MSVLASTIPPAPAVPPRARALGARLAGLSGHDSELVGALNDAHHRLAGANDRLLSGPAGDPLVIHHQIDRASAPISRRQSSAERSRSTSASSPNS